jgi:hypothetical protein
MALCWIRSIKKGTFEQVPAEYLAYWLSQRDSDNKPEWVEARDPNAKEELSAPENGGTDEPQATPNAQGNGTQASTQGDTEAPEVKPRPRPRARSRLEPVE